MGVGRQRGSDDEAGDDEEHVHTGEAARQPGTVQVVDDDGKHRNGAQSVDVFDVASR